jgi:O-antigen ligase
MPLGDGFVDRTVTPERAPLRLRLALRVVQFGALAVVLAASTHRMFDLDRFFIPKELVLHLTALIAGVLSLRFIRRARIDWMLFAYLAMSVAAAVFATNPWLAVRALAISASAIALFFVARALRDAGLAPQLLGGLALAVVVGAITSLLQTYGLRLDVFSLSRAPGGTLGNRNFVAHAAAFGFPLVLFAALRGRSIALFGVTIVSAALVLTRSRAAWLAFAAMLLVYFIAMLRRDGRPWKRLLLGIAFAAIGVAAAIAIPNTLRWRSDNPYLESMQDVANYQEGSGRGRLIQYERSVRMAATTPVVGVGPGNWAVEYPEHAARNDPSLDPSVRGMTFNPWPSSDWVAFAAERGFIALLLMAFVFVAFALDGLRRGDEVLLGTVVAAGVAGAFDAVLLLALPALLVWTALGATYATPPNARRTNALLLLLVLAISALGVARSGAQLTAMHLFATRGDRASLELASRIDPGNYRLHLRLARIGKRADRDDHRRAARALFPHAGE